MCFLFCLSSSCVLCTKCCQCFWIIHSWLPLRFSLTFIYFSVNRCLSYNTASEQCVYTDCSSRKFREEAYDLVVVSPLLAIIQRFVRDEYLPSVRMLWVLSFARQKVPILSVSSPFTCGNQNICPQSQLSATFWMFKTLTLPRICWDGKLSIRLYMSVSHPESLSGYAVILSSCVVDACCLLDELNRWSRKNTIWTRNLSQLEIMTQWNEP